MFLRAKLTAAAIDAPKQLIYSAFVAATIYRYSKLVFKEFCAFHGRKSLYIGRKFTKSPRVTHQLCSRKLFYIETVLMFVGKLMFYEGKYCIESLHPIYDFKCIYVRFAFRQHE